jgi:hypothetical protein
MHRSLPRTIGLCLLFAFAAQNAFAIPCVNKFLCRSDGAKKVVTLLTGKLTFQEAQERAKSGPIEWVDEKGKTVAKSVELRVVRPMPVGCDGKTSGVVMVATFISIQPPSKKMNVKLSSDTTVTFDEQAGE